ncbi:MAG: NAD-dependent DNA ligase LigA, partial [Deltaproteobacteria bacterium]|nr:NAD-dependent DNA ligase LigA [Deltaproteobacteria bacterium]
MLDLCLRLHQSNHAYYSGISEIDDFTYDKTKKELIELESKFPAQIQEDSPLIQVHAEPQSSFSSRVHRNPMLSLANVYSVDELREWETGLKK